MEELKSKGDCKIVKVEIINRGGDADTALTYPAKFGAPAGCEEGSAVCSILDVKRTESSDSTFKVKVT